jgi:hypothetical protein
LSTVQKPISSFSGQGRLTVRSISFNCSENAIVIYFFNMRLRMLAIPMSPMPRSSMEAGSGTEVMPGIWDMALATATPERKIVNKIA